MLKYENVSLLLVILYIVYDLLFNVLYYIMFRYRTLTYYGIITTIIEIALLYSMTKRLIKIIKKEVLATPRKELTTSINNAQR